MNDLPDEALVEVLRTGPVDDVRAFEVLVERYQARILANCRYLTRSHEAAEDLAQEVFVKAFFALRSFEGRSSFRTWLQRIKVNHCLNHLRRTQGAVMVDLDDQVAAGHEALRLPPSADVDIDAAKDRDRIVAVLDGMSDTLRIPLMLRDGDGHSYEDIAAELGISLSAVKMRIKRAREEFRLRFSAGAGPVARDLESA